MNEIFSEIRPDLKESDQILSNPTESDSTANYRQEICDKSISDNSVDNIFQNAVPLNTDCIFSSERKAKGFLYPIQ